MTSPEQMGPGERAAWANGYQAGFDAGTAKPNEPNLGFATTEHLIAELTARLSICGCLKYKTVDDV